MRRRARLPVLALGLAVLASCATPRQAQDEAPLTWPEELDEPARIAYVRSFSTPEDVGIEKGFLQKVGEFLFGGVEARLLRPMAVVVANGAIYVADTAAHGVHRFDMRDGRYDLIGVGADAKLPSPVGLAVGANGEVYVADSELASVLVIRPGAKEAVPLALEKMGQPTGIAYDRATGRLYVTDTSVHRVEVFDRDGKRVAGIGQRGTDDGEFNYPTHLWRDAQGRLYVTDSLNFRVQVFDSEGRFLRSFGRVGDSAGDFMRQKGVATDSWGHVYVVDGLMSAVQIFDGEGRLLLVLGNLGKDRGEFWLPTGIFIGDKDEIYVADSYNGRVQVFRYVGGPT